MKRKRSEGESAPVTLGQAQSARVRLIVWCKSCAHRIEPDIDELVAHHGSCDDGDRLGGASCLLSLRSTRC
jgi:hypothetical protein